jgi:hypothetical protein
MLPLNRHHVSTAMTHRSLLGPIIRLQVQPHSLKREVDGKNIYDPSGLISVDSLILTPTGSAYTHAEGVHVLDVHNTQHPQSKHWGENPFSVGFTSHYAAMAKRFGAHMYLGCAGEGIIIETTKTITIDDMAGTMVIATKNGPVKLAQIIVATPCAPFSTFALANPQSTTADLKSALQFLNHGTRGFYCQLVEEIEAVIRPGDLAYLEA